MNNGNSKVYVVVRYVPAKNLADALKKEKTIPPHDVFLDEYSKTLFKEEIVQKDVRNK